MWHRLFFLSFDIVSDLFLDIGRCYVGFADELANLADPSSFFLIACWLGDDGKSFLAKNASAIVKYINIAKKGSI